MLLWYLVIVNKGCYIFIIILSVILICSWFKFNVWFWILIKGKLSVCKFEIWKLLYVYYIDKYIIKKGFIFFL